MKQKMELLSKMSFQLGAWSQKIEHLNEKSGQFGREQKKELAKQIQILKGKQKQAKENLNELKNSSEDVWDDIKDGVEKAWDDLKDAFDSAHSKYDAIKKKK